MAGFEELGLNDELIESARAHGFDAPSALQRSVIPVIRRGGNAVIRAASGSGITAAYAIALVDRFAEGEGTRALVIVPTIDRAERVARTIARFTHGSSVTVSAMTNAWPAADTATILVASAEKLLESVQSSALKLEGIESVVIDNAAATMKLATEPALETILSSLPKDGQRIIISADMNDAVRKLAESHARKALTFPARAAVENESQAGEPDFTVKYTIAANEKKSDIIARLARKGGGPITVLSRRGAAAETAVRELASRGFEARAARYDDFDRSKSTGSLYAFDPPFSAEQLTDHFIEGDTIICERQELPHLKMIAGDANVRLDAASLPRFEVDSLNAFRNEIRRAAREEDLESQMLILEPLFNEMSAEEIAAAACALLRTRRPLKAEPAAAGKRPGMKTWSRLFLSVGERDGVRAGDIVGAITGESGIAGEDVGKVEIRDTFCVVEIDSSAADKVIAALNGTTMKNRALRVDYDRKTSATPSRSGPRAGGSGPRSSGNRQPRDSSGRPPRDSGSKPRDGRFRESGPRRDGPRRDGPSRDGPPRGGRAPSRDR